MNLQKIRSSLKFIDKAILLLGMLVVPLLTFAQDKPEQVIVDKIIARVDDYIILNSELEKAYLEVLSRGDFQGNKDRKSVV